MENKYKLAESDLEIGSDLEFIDQLINSYDVEAESETRRYLLDLSYTLARNKLVEARRFANLANKSCIDVEDIKITHMEKTEDFQLGTLQLTKPIVQHLTTPSVTTSLLLPPWRNCQVGANAELKQLLLESQANNNSTVTGTQKTTAMATAMPTVTALPRTVPTVSALPRTVPTVSANLLARFGQRYPKPNF